MGFVKSGKIIIILRVKKCEISDSNGSTIYPIHSYATSGETCFDQRLGVTQISNSPNIEIQFRSFRFTVDGILGDSDRINIF